MKFLSLAVMTIAFLTGAGYAPPAKAANCVVNLVINNTTPRNSASYITAKTRTKTRANAQWLEKTVFNSESYQARIRPGETFRTVLTMELVGCHIARQGELYVTCVDTNASRNTSTGGNQVVKFWGGGYARPTDVVANVRC